MVNITPRNHWTRSYANLAGGAIILPFWQDDQRWHSGRATLSGARSDQDYARMLAIEAATLRAPVMVHFFFLLNFRSEPDSSAI